MIFHVQKVFQSVNIQQFNDSMDEITRSIAICKHPCKGGSPESIDQNHNFPVSVNSHPALPLVISLKSRLFNSFTTEEYILHSYCSLV